jgi:hypothetical protein
LSFSEGGGPGPADGTARQGGAVRLPDAPWLVIGAYLTVSVDW